MKEFDDRTGVVPASCPYCGEELNAATDTDGDARPSEGDVSLCAYCAGLLVFDAEGKLRLPTDAELVELRRDPAVVWARQNLLAWIHQRSS